MTGLHLQMRCDWARPEGGGALALADGALVARAVSRWQRFDPFSDSPLLFRSFCDLDGSAESFLAFASSYGLLEVRPDGDGQREPLSAWSRLHELLGLAVARYDLAGELAGSLPPGGGGEAMMRVVIEAAQSIGDGLVPYFGVEPVAALVEGRPRLGLRVVTRTLRSALILQFLGCMLTGGLHARCGGCGRWFDRADGEGRIDRRACSAACRTRVYRRRLGGRGAA